MEWLAIAVNLSIDLFRKYFLFQLRFNFVIIIVPCHCALHCIISRKKYFSEFVNCPITVRFLLLLSPGNAVMLSLL